jgi:hypothetical protein
VNLNDTLLSGSDEKRVTTPLIDFEGGLDLLHHMGEHPDAVIYRSVHAGFQFLSRVCFHLLELGRFKLVLADHQ